MKLTQVLKMQVINLARIFILLITLSITVEISGQETYRDNFNTASYGNNNGSQNFGSNWSESGDDGSATGGRIEIVSNQLEFNNIDSRSISRTLDLSGASSANLTLSYNRTNGDESLLVQLYNGSSYNTIATLSGTGSVNYDLVASEISASSAIRFISGSGNWGSSETIYVDNVVFTAVSSPIITIANVTVDEGAGTTTFTATHTGANASGAFTVAYQTVNGSATAGSDYTSIGSGTLNFNGTAGDTEQITVTITDDSTIESSETFTVQFTGTSDGSVDITDTATGTITDNDSLVIGSSSSSTTCNSVFFDSGGSGSNYTDDELITHTICPSTAGASVSLNFTSFDVENGYDFLYVYEGTSTAGTLIGTYHNGNVPTTITSSDGSGCLTFLFDSDGSVQGAGWQATISCILPSPVLTIADVTVNENAGTAVFTVTHTGMAASGPFTVSYNTVDGLATAGTDFTSITGGTLNFDGTLGDTDQITVNITNDTSAEGTEAFSIQFTTSSDSSVDISDTATGTILDDEVILNDTPLVLFNEFNGYYDYAVTGGSLRDQSNTVNACSITATSSVTGLTTTIPGTATIERAYLLWAHSNQNPDTQVTFEGQTVNADIVYSSSLSGNRLFYGMMSDVTTLINGIPNPSTNVYDFSNLNVDNTDTFAQYCSTATTLGGWSLIIFYEEPTLPAVSVNMYHGFKGESNTSNSYTLDGFFAIGATGAKTTVLSWEGDSTLDGSSAGTTNPNGESLIVTNEAGTPFTQTGDGGQTGNNAYNSTIYDNTVSPVINTTNSYGVDLDTYDISSYIAPADSQITVGVNAGQDFVIANLVLVKVPSNLIVGNVFEDVNYGGGSGRDQATSGGADVEGATVELYNNSGTLDETVTTDASGQYSIGGMANGNYSVRVVNNSVNSTRGGGTTCATCLPVQTFRRNYVTGVGFTDVTAEIGGADSSNEDVAAGTLTNAQTVAAVSISSEGVVGLDFGFNFNSIVNTNEDGQGSLEQFIVNANNLDETGLDIEANGIFNPAAGEDTSVFVIPSTGDPLGRTADANFASGYFDISISNGNPLTDITDSNTKLDGRTQTAYSGDTNTGTVGSGGSLVGTSANSLPNYDRPEIQVHRNSGDVLKIQGNNTVIRNLAIYANANAGILQSAGNTVSINESLFGVNALGVATGNMDYGVEITGGSSTVDGNFFSNNSNAGILVNGGTSTIIQNNHITDNGLIPCGDNITLESGSGIVIQQNLIDNAASFGIDGDGMSGSITITENTITNSGQNGAACNGNIENAGILLDGDNSSISNNIIATNGGPGIVLAGGNTSGNLISQNSIYGNGTASDALGIDLDISDDVGDGVTLNDTSDSDNGPNGAINFPIISSAYYTATNMVIEGWSRPGATIELFLTDVNEGTASTGDNELGFSIDYGEGQTYLATVVEGSGSDTDAGVSVYTDNDGNTDNTNKYRFSIALPPSANLGSLVTATATLANSTSEFSPMSILKAYTIITNRRITYRVNQ